MKKNLFLICLLSFYLTNSQGLFDWETAIDNGDTVSQVVGEVTLVASSDDTSFNLLNWNGPLLDGKVPSTFGLANSITLTFSKAVDITSIRILNNYDTDYDWSFIPIGGNNSIVNEEVLKGESEVVSLNWIGVTKVTIIGEVGNLYYTIGDVVTQPSTLSVQESTIFKELKVYPTVFTDFVTISGVELKRSLEIQLFSIQGKSINTFFLNNNNNRIDLSNLSLGIYFLKLTIDDKTIIKKVIKK